MCIRDRPNASRTGCQPIIPTAQSCPLRQGKSVFRNDFLDRPGRHSRGPFGFSGRGLLDKPSCNSYLATSETDCGTAPPLVKCCLPCRFRLPTSDLRSYLATASPSLTANLTTRVRGQVGLALQPTYPVAAFWQGLLLSLIHT